MSKISNVQIWPINGHKTMKANASFVYNDALRISCQVVQGAKGLFVSLPREKYTKDGKDAWADKVFCMDKDLYKEIQDTVIAAYTKGSGTVVDQGRSREPVSQVRTTEYRSPGIVEDNIPF